MAERQLSPLEQLLRSPLIPGAGLTHQFITQALRDRAGGAPDQFIPEATGVDQPPDDRVKAWQKYKLDQIQRFLQSLQGPGTAY
jgi:hypothetical protein